MIHNKLVSVIIPTYNRAALLRRALNSVFNQTYRPIEVVIVDDGSTDDTTRIVEDWRLGKENSDFTVIFISQRNKGAPAARNLGYTSSRGDYIQFFDSDDVLVEEKIEAQVLALQLHKSASFAWSGCVTQRGAPRTHLFRVGPERWKFSRTKPTEGFRVPIATGIFRRGACDQIGLWTESLRRHQDWEYGVRYLASGAKSVSSDQVGYITMAHNGGRIDDLDSNTFDRIGYLEAACSSAEEKSNGPGCSAAKIRIAQYYSVAMIQSLLSGHRLSARRFLTKIRRLLPVKTVVRAKNELLYFGVVLLGARFCRFVVRHFVSNGSRIFLKKFDS
jgi:glycosyltransferase involved in cell wall biosynthesis